MKNKPKLKKVSKKNLILAGSLLVNLIFLTHLAIWAWIQQSGQLDQAFINSARDIACSERFRDSLKGDTRKAINDFDCQKNGANEYWQNGFKDFANSKGITIEEY